jgi:hypothetical protein
MNGTNLGNCAVNGRDGAVRRPYQKRWFQRRRRHDPWLVLNMSFFNFQPGRNEIFNPLRNYENVWS